MSTTWRSIEKDPPEEGKWIWISSINSHRGKPTLWNLDTEYGYKAIGWTHWSPCEPPADLPPKPRTPFEEWVDGFQKLDFGCVWITDNRGTGGRVAACMAKIIFNAGYDAGKASR